MDESFLAEPTQLERNLEVDNEAWKQLTAPSGDNPSSFLSSRAHILHSKLQGILNGHKAENNPPNRDFCMVVQRWKNSLMRTTPVSLVPTSPHLWHCQVPAVPVMSPRVLKPLLTGRNSQWSPVVPQILQLLCCTHTQHCHTTVFMYVITFSLNNSRIGFRWKDFDSKGFSAAPERPEQMTFLAESAEAQWWAVLIWCGPYHSHQHLHGHKWEQRNGSGL